MQIILFIHQSAEMYGSDKVLLSLVEGLDKSCFRPIVLLPSEGPLMDALRASKVETHVVPLVRFSRATLSVSGVMRLPYEIWRSLRAMNRVLDGVNISIVHSNTLAVLSGALWAKFHYLPHVWHVHEMIVRPKVVREGFPWLLRIFADRVACNSNATLQLLLESQPILAKKSVTIWNGMARSVPPDVEAARLFRQELGLGQHDVLVVLMGRINRWKGQRLLIDAASQVAGMGFMNARYLIVGSTPQGQENFMDELKHALSLKGVGNLFTVMGFREDIWPIWDAADIAVVPSTEPEPFGMVALEAMAAGKTVVAAAHGGLLDIVVDGVTGMLVSPNDANALAVALVSLARDKSARKRMGQEGLKRLDEHFSLKHYVGGFEQLYGAVNEERL